MIPEERFERQMEFILKQQANFYANMVELDERLSRRIGKNAEQIQENVGQIQQLTNLMVRLGRVVDEMGRQTDQRLNKLIDLMERRPPD
ncbi:hypothetical protein MYX84_16480 [Acidobacteria bacterium AH-259-O06]|nr:hypothetical protein [Acidobacteria bacterium AH-259-O06]